MKYLTRGLFVGAVLLICASHAWAGFSLVPGLVLREEYNDNIYLDASDEVDDFITTLTPTLLMTWETPRIDLSLDARIMLQKYADNSDEDRIGPGEADQASTFNALVRIYPDVFFLRVTDTYQRVPIDEGDRGGEGNNSVNLSDENRLEINPYLQFQPMSDLLVALGYTYENLWYGNEDENDPDLADDEGDDAEIHTYSLKLTKGLSSRIDLILEGMHQEYRPKDPLDIYVIDEEGAYEFDKDLARISLNYQVSDRLKLKCGYGHAWLEYDVRDDTDSSVWDASIDYEVSSTFKAGLAYSRDYVVTVSDGPVDQDLFSATVEYGDRIKVLVSAFMSENDYLEIDRDDDAYGGKFSCTIPFTDKFGTQLGLGYTNYDESGVDKEEYDRYETNVSIYYDISLGRLSLGHIYNDNDSDVDGNDYRNNISYLQASLKF